MKSFFILYAIIIAIPIISSNKTLSSNLHMFQLYAPPLVYGEWTTTGFGCSGNCKFSFEVEPMGDTQLFCQLNCCRTQIEMFGSADCIFNCSGQPSVHCYGNPFGTSVQGYQYY